MNINELGLGMSLGQSGGYGEIILPVRSTIGDFSNSLAVSKISAETVFEHLYGFTVSRQFAYSIIKKIIGAPWCQTRKIRRVNGRGRWAT